MTYQAVRLLCPHCGATLSVSEAMGKSVACSYCGTSLAIQKSEGTVFLTELGDAISRVQAGTDRTAAELAVRRLSEDLARLETGRRQLTTRREGVVTAHRAELTGRYLAMGCLAFVVPILGLVILGGLFGRERVNLSLPYIMFIAGAVILFLLVRKHRAREREVDAQTTAMDARSSQLDAEMAHCRGRIAEKRAIADS